jgi:hypothetical protein
MWWLPFLLCARVVKSCLHSSCTAQRTNSMPESRCCTLTCSCSCSCCTSFSRSDLQHIGSKLQECSCVHSAKAASDASPCTAIVRHAAALVWKLRHDCLCTAETNSSSAANVAAVPHCASAPALTLTSEPGRRLSRLPTPAAAARLRLHVLPAPGCALHGTALLHTVGLQGLSRHVHPLGVAAAPAACPTGHTWHPQLNPGQQCAHSCVGGTHRHRSHKSLAASQ